MSKTPKDIKNKLRASIGLQPDGSPFPNSDMKISPDAMRLVVFAKRQKNTKFVCYVLDNSANKNFKDFLKLLEADDPRLVPQEGSKRFQLLVHNNTHYTAIDLKVSRSSKQCILLDAVGDRRGNILARDALDSVKGDGSALFDRVIQASAMRTGPIQKDGCSCSMFALDHAINISKFDDSVYDELHDVRMIGMNNFLNQSGVSWQSMPQELVHNAHSKEWTDEYSQENKKLTQEDKDAFNTYISKYTELEEVDGVKRKINRATWYIYETCQETVKRLVERYSEAKLRTILKKQTMDLTQPSVKSATQRFMPSIAANVIKSKPEPQGFDDKYLPIQPKTKEVVKSRKQASANAVSKSDKATIPPQDQIGSPRPK